MTLVKQFTEKRKRKYKDARRKHTYKHVLAVAVPCSATATDALKEVNHFTPLNIATSKIHLIDKKKVLHKKYALHFAFVCFECMKSAKRETCQKIKPSFYNLCV